MDLWISSKKCSFFTVSGICKLLKKHEVQVTSTCSSVDGEIEDGFHIKFMDMPAKDIIKKTIWDELAATLDLKCAFVFVPNSYQGCVQNWPGVFTPSLCAKGDRKIELTL